jgi:hypothetical protein
MGLTSAGCFVHVDLSLLKSDRYQASAGWLLGFEVRKVRQLVIFDWIVEGWLVGWLAGERGDAQSSLLFCLGWSKNGAKTAQDQDPTSSEKQPTEI